MIPVDADHLHRLCSFIRWAATGVVRSTDVERAGVGSAGSSEGVGDSRQQAAGRSDCDTRPHEAFSLLWAKADGETMGVEDSIQNGEHQRQVQDEARDVGRDIGGKHGGGEHGVGTRGETDTAFDEDSDVRGMWATSEELERTGEYLMSTLHPATIKGMHARSSGELEQARTSSLGDLGSKGSSGGRPHVEIHEPHDGADVLFPAFAAKEWQVRATVRDFELGHGVGYACVYLDGTYKVMLVFLLCLRWAVDMPSQLPMMQARTDGTISSHSSLDGAAHSFW